MNKVLLRPLFREAYLKKTKKLPVKKFNVGGFSKVEKRNLLLTPITSALLQARTMPGESQLGSVFRSIGKGMEKLPQTQLAIKQIELEQQEREERKKDKKFASSKKVLDQDTGKIIFADEETIQTTYSSKQPNQFRYVPVPDPEKAGKPMKVYDTETQSVAYAPQGDILTAKNSSGELRYLPVGKEDSLVKAYPIIDGVQSDTSQFVTKAQILENPEGFVPVEGNLEMMMKMKDIDRMKKQKTDAENAMLAARDVGEIITRIEKDVAKQGAFTGNAADTVLAITGMTGFIDSFVSRNKQKEGKLFTQQYQDTEDAISQLTNEDSPNFNAKITAYLNAPETQAAKTSIINLAYAIAKAREPGGRFSVPDIELALQSIGESSNKQTFLAGLRRIGLEITGRALTDYETIFNVTRDEIPKGYNKVGDQYDYFSGVQFTEQDKNKIDPKNLFGAN
jgi:hypothetical protein